MHLLNDKKKTTLEYTVLIFSMKIQYTCVSNTHD